MPRAEYVKRGNHTLAENVNSSAVQRCARCSERAKRDIIKFLRFEKFRRGVTAAGRGVYL